MKSTDFLKGLKIRRHLICDAIVVSVVGLFLTAYEHRLRSQKEDRDRELLERLYDMS